MADASIDLQGIDTFGLGAQFEPQSGSKSTKWKVSDRKSKIGDTKEIVSKGESYEWSQDYEYNGADLATDLTVKLAEVTGDDGILLEEVSITFAESAPVKISLKGHNHKENPHEGVCLSGDTATGIALDLAAIIGDGVGGWDVPANMPFANSDVDSSAVGLSLSFKVDHTDKPGYNGEHLVGVCMNPMVTASVDYVGSPTLTTTGWVVESDETGQSNQDFDTTKISAKRPLARG